MALICSEEAVVDWLWAHVGSATVLAPQQGADGAHRYKEVTRRDQLDLAGYRSSQLPPGKCLSPARDVLLTFDKTEEGGFVAEPVLDTTSRILVGVRPCDLRGIALMDAVNSEGHADPSYLTRRAHTRIVAWACAVPCDEACFCEAVQSLDWTEGADVMLAPTVDGLLADGRTVAGDVMLASLAGTPCDAPEEVWESYRRERPSPFGRQLDGTVEQIQEAMRDSWSSPVWTEYAETCLSCGSCNLVCPTCYCFDTFDEVELSDPSCGRRCRTWDSCMLPEFAVVAGGHDFRSTTAARHRHRVKRKFEYLPDRFDGSFCVGCGRCSTQCTVGIDIFDMANAVLAGVKA